MFKHLLVPLDGSALAESALPVALEIADRFDSEISLLRVVRPPMLLTELGSPDLREIFVNLREDLRQEAAVYLEARQTALRTQGYNVNGRAAESDSVAEIILNTADELGVDAIVMNTHGRSGIKRWVFGSVADKVLQYARVPVLLIRAQPQEGEPPITVPAIEDLEDIRSHEE